MNKKENPLVSIIVITYNSSQYVLETLESCKEQTYKNIELIISDDASKDSTVAICEKWINEHKNRFVRTKIVNAEKNTGIPANCNRGIEKADGVWIKMIAGDDILKKECIEDNTNFICKDDTINVLLSSTRTFINEFDTDNFKGALPSKKQKNDFFNNSTTATTQYFELLLGDKIQITPSAFIKKETISKVGMYDEKYRFIEDYPMWLKLTRSGFKIYFMDKVTVYHRKHNLSVNNIKGEYIFKPAYFRNELLRREYVYPYLTRLERNKRILNYYYANLFRMLGLLEDHKRNRILMTIFQKYLNPYSYITFLLRFGNYTPYKKET